MSLVTDLSVFQFLTSDLFTGLLKPAIATFVVLTIIYYAAQGEIEQSSVISK